MELTKSIRRQFKRYLEIDDADKFLGTLNQDNPDLNTPSLLKRLPTFFESVNSAYSDYDDKLRLSSRSLEISSQELNSANRKLEQLISSTNAMMDSLRQGLLFFDQNGLCSSVFSKICLDFFDTSPEGKNVGDLLRLDSQEKIDLNLWLDAVFSADLAMDIADLYDMAPQKFNNNGKILRLEYRPMQNDRGKMIAILMIATDITKEIAYENDLSILEDNASKIVAIANNRNNFIDFMCEIENFVHNELLDLWRNHCPNLVLRLHTYKGLASSFYLSDLAQQIHELENLHSKYKAISDAHLDDHLAGISKEIAKAKDFGKNLFGDGLFVCGKTKIVSTRSLGKLNELLQSAAPEIREFFERDFLSAPVSDAFDPFIKEIKRLSAAQQKISPQISMTGGDIRFPEEKYKNLFESFIHIARNIVDHGIELPSQRMESGKNPQALITINITIDDQHLKILISDDGNGINKDKLWASVKTHDLAKDRVWTDENILQSVFLPTISTANKKTIVSGRGVGLAAVHEEVEKLGGKIEIRSQKSSGTTLEITVPLAKQAHQ